MLIVAETNQRRMIALEQAGKDLPQVYFAGSRMFTVNGAANESPKEIQDAVLGHAQLTHREGFAAHD